MQDLELCGIWGYTGLDRWSAGSLRVSLAGYFSPVRGGICKMSKAQGIPSSLTSEAQRHGDKLPPVHLWNPPLCENVDMHIDREGNWYYQNSPIGRKRMVQLFSRLLRYDPDGHYYLVTPVEKVRLVVDCAPFVAIDVEPEGTEQERTLTFTTNTGDSVVCDSEHPLWVEQGPLGPEPFVMVRSNLKALVHRYVYYRLVDMAELHEQDGKQALGLHSRGQWFSLGEVQS